MTQTTSPSKILEAVAILHSHCDKSLCASCFFGQEKGKKCLLDDLPPYKWDQIALEENPAFEENLENCCLLEDTYTGCLEDDF